MALSQVQLMFRSLHNSVHVADSLLLLALPCFGEVLTAQDDTHVERCS